MRLAILLPIWSIAVVQAPSACAPKPTSSQPGPQEQSSPSNASASPEIMRELETMKARIEQLEQQLKMRGASVPAPSALQDSAKAMPASPAAAAREASDAQTTNAPSAPFAYADWTWLNGNPRNKDAVWDSKFIPPEIRLDADYIADFNHPKDDTVGGSTEVFRSNEVQLEQISFGGNFHWQNVNARILTMGGMFSVTTPRNDASEGRGQWNLRGAYKYFSEANAGYHFDVNHGLNVDAGIFCFLHWPFQLLQLR